MSKKSINSVIPFLENIVDNSLNQDRIKKMLIEETGVGSKDLPPEAEIFVSVWIDSMMHGICDNKEKLKNDFIVDYVLCIMKYFESVQSKSSLENFDEYFESLMSNPLFIEIMNDKSFVESLMKVKEEHGSKILELLKSEENMEYFKKNISKIMPGFKFVDKDMFGL
jgi:hypothetical protein